jgi:antitoxin (DNA-binding transcriptional repressor) of toxin-antitoxin stability system
MFDTEDGHVTVNVTEFKAKCLDFLARLDSGTLAQVTVTKRGKAVAIVRPSPPPDIKDSAWGFMQGSIRIAPGIDLAEPVIDEEPDDPFIGKNKADDAAA